MSKIGKGSSLLKEQDQIRCNIREFETCLVGQSQTFRSRSDHVRFAPDADRIADIVASRFRADCVAKVAGIPLGRQKRAILESEGAIFESRFSI